MPFYENRESQSIEVSKGNSDREPVAELVNAMEAIEEDDRQGPNAGGFVRCPQCRSMRVEKVLPIPSWLVILGPIWAGALLLTCFICHCRCRKCGATFNGKTGKSDFGIICLAMLIGTVITAVVLVLFIAYTHRRGVR